jgi:hypothetical protein
MVPKQKSNNMEVVKNIIEKVFYFLEEEYLYSSVYNAEEDSTFIESLNVEYVNELKRRKVRIGYTKANVYNDIKYTFSCSISRIPYINVEDFFSLSNYLQSIDRDFPTSLVDDFSEVKAENILAQIAAALKEYAGDIIDGKEWSETYYSRKD